METLILLVDFKKLKVKQSESLFTGCLINLHKQNPVEALAGALSEALELPAALVPGTARDMVAMC